MDFFDFRTKNVGLIQFEGSTCDLVAYYRNGSFIIKRKAGFNGKTIEG